MKIKSINKYLLIILLFGAMFVSVFAFAGCKKTFEPKTLTTEQAKQLVNDAIIKAKSATNIYAEYGDGLYAYADAEGYYSKSYEDPSEDLYQETWRVIQGGEWIAYYYFSYGSGEMESANKWVTHELYGATNYVEYLVGYNIPSFDEEFDDYNETVTGTQTAENAYKVSLKYVDDQNDVEYVIEYEINGEFIKSFKFTETYEGEETETEEISFRYNIADQTIPELPNIKWD